MVNSSRAISPAFSGKRPVVGTESEARMEMAGKQATPFYIPALVVLLCGFLMIYSIIHVAMDQDTRFFAGLKTLGMTPRQIRWFLLEKAGLLSLFGLLPGWLMGFGIHYLVTPRIVTGMEQNPAIYFLSWETFALAALRRSPSEALSSTSLDFRTLTSRTSLRPRKSPTICSVIARLLGLYRCTVEAAEPSSMV